ncbi:MAG: uroporphyrinogen decarboxylase family protein [Omnitrophica WOR_2 bacterium]
MLTRRERVMRTLQFQETDRVPVYDIFQNDAIIEHYAAEILNGKRYSVEDGLRVKGFAIGRTLDMTRMPEGPCVPGEFVNEDRLRIHQERWTSWIVERPFKDIPQMLDWVQWEIQKTNALTYGTQFRRNFHRWLEECAAYYTAGDPTGRADPPVQIVESGVGLTEIYWMLGWDFFTALMFDYPDLLEEWLEARHQAELRRVAAIANPRRIPVALTYDDIAYKNGLLISPKWLRQHWAPRLERLVESWHSRDTYCIFHSDGNLWAILDDLVAAGIDGLNPLEVLAGMSVKAVRQRYPKLALTGGIDVSQLLSLGTPEEVRQACRQAIEDAGGRGYFLGSTTELHWDVKLENAIAMLEEPLCLYRP